MNDETRLTGEGAPPSAESEVEGTHADQGADADEGDVEGHSLLYEQARTFARDRERDAQRQARESRWFKDRKDQKR